MGTRSLTVFAGPGGKEIVVMYRQCDGYPSGHGKELLERFGETRIVNGIRGDEPEPFANGMGCLAAQAVEHFKKAHGAGGIYLHGAGTRNCGEEYLYTVGQAGDVGSDEGARLSLRVEGRDRVLYDGPLCDFEPDADYEAPEEPETCKECGK